MIKKQENIQVIPLPVRQISSCPIISELIYTTDAMRA